MLEDKSKFTIEDAFFFSEWVSAKFYLSMFGEMVFQIRAGFGGRWQAAYP